MSYTPSPMENRPNTDVSEMALAARDLTPAEVREFVEAGYEATRPEFDGGT